MSSHTQTKTVAHLTAGDSSLDVAFAPDGGTAYVADLGGQRISYSGGERGRGLHPPCEQALASR